MANHQSLARSGDDAKLEELATIFDEYVSGTTINQLVEKYGVSRRTINNRLDAARRMYSEMIKNSGDKYFADVWHRYLKIFDIANAGWETTRDPAFLREMRACLDSQRKMMSLDMPAKLPESSKNTNENEQLVFIMDDAEYKKREEAYAQEQAQATVIDGSTNLPLNDDEEIE